MNRIPWVCILSVIALLSFYAVSTLLLAVLGLSPRTPLWQTVPTLASVLAIAGAAVTVQSFPHRLSQPLYRTAGIVSGGASGAVLGFFYGGHWSGQATQWAVIGLVIGSLVLMAIAAVAYGDRHQLSPPLLLNRRVNRQANKLSNRPAQDFSPAQDFVMVPSPWHGGAMAIALISGICAYGLAFGLGAWAFAALSTGHVGLSIPLGLLTGLSLWGTRRSWRVIAHYWRSCWPRRW